MMGLLPFAWRYYMTSIIQIKAPLFVLVATVVVWLLRRLLLDRRIRQVRKLSVSFEHFSVFLGLFGL